LKKLFKKLEKTVENRTDF